MQSLFVARLALLTQRLQYTPEKCGILRLQIYYSCREV